MDFFYEGECEVYWTKKYEVIEDGMMKMIELRSRTKL
jgi:hypothetical protein